MSEAMTQFAIPQLTQQAGVPMAGVLRSTSLPGVRESAPPQKLPSSVAPASTRAVPTREQVDAFNELVRAHENLAYGIALRMLRSREDASDAVQESFLKAFVAFSSFKGGSFKSWLARIVVNSCYDALRRDRRLALEELVEEPLYEGEGKGTKVGGRLMVDPHESPQGYVERMELWARIELGLRTLPVDQRLVLTLYDIQGYSYDEVCEITGMPIGTVKSRINRARRKMRDFLWERGS